MLFFLMMMMRNFFSSQNTIGGYIRGIIPMASFMAKDNHDTEIRALTIAEKVYPFLKRLRQEATVDRGISEKDIYTVVCQMADEHHIFSMDDLVELTELFPDEILPPYRKQRQYINSIMALNEVSKSDMPYCKEAFLRVGRGMYILNPDVVF